MSKGQVSVKIRAAFDTAFNSTFASADEKIKDLNKSLRNLKNSAANLEGLKKARDNVSALNTELGKKSKELDEVNAKLKVAVAAEAAHSAAIDQARQKVAASRQEHHLLNENLRRLQATLQQAAQPTAAQVEAMQKLKAAVDGSRNALRAAGQEASMAARALEKKRQSVEKLNARIREQEASLTRAQDVAKSATERHAQLRSEYDRERIAMEKLAAPTSEQRAALARLRDEAKLAAAAKATAHREVERLTRSLDLEKQRALDAANGLSVYEARSRSATAAVEAATAEHRKLTGELSRMRRSMAGELSDSQKAELAAQQQRVAAAEKAIAAARAEQSAAVAVQKTYQAAAEKSGGTASILAREQKNLSNTVEATNSQITKATATVRQYETALEKAGVDVKNVTAAEEKLNSTIARQSTSLSTAKSARRLSDRASELRSEALGHSAFTLGYGYIFTAPLREAVQFEKAMVRVKAMSGANAEEFKRLKEQARDLGASTIYTAKEVAEAQNELATAGYRTNDIIAVMPSMLALAESSMTSLARTAEITSEVLQGFRIDVSEMARVGDALTAAYTGSASSLESLGEMLKYVAASSVDVGSSLEQTLAMSSVLHNNGIKGSMAGTTARAIFLRLAKPPKELQRVLDEMHVSTKDAAGNMRDWMDIIGDMNRAMRGVGTAKKAAVSKALGGEEHAPGASIIMNAQKDGSLKLSQRVFELSPAFNGMAKALLKIPDTELRAAADNLGVKFNRAMSGGGIAAAIAGSLKGLKGSEAKGQMQKIISELKLGPKLSDMTAGEFTGEGKEADAALKRLGIKRTKALGGTKTSSELTAEIKSQIQTLPIEDKLKYIEIFFSRTRNGVKDLMEEFARSGKNFDQLLQALNEAQNMEKIKKELSASTANQLGEISGDFNDIMITFGEAFIPVLREMMVWLKPILNGFGEWLKANQGVAKVIMQTVGALFAFSAAMAIGKLALSGFFTLGAGFMNLKKAWDFGFGKDRPLRNAAGKAWDMLKDTDWKGVGRNMSLGMKSVKRRMGGALKSGLGFAGKGLKGGWGLAKNLGNLGLQGIKVGAGAAASGLGSLMSMARAAGGALLAMGPAGWAITAVITAIAVGGYLIYKNWATIKPWLLKTWESIKTYFVDLWVRVAGVVSTAWGWIKEHMSWHPVVYIAKNWEKLVGMFKAVYEKIKPYISKIFPTDDTEIKVSGEKPEEPGFLTRLFGGTDDSGASMLDNPLKKISGMMSQPDLPNTEKAASGGSLNQKNIITVTNTFTMTGVQEPRQVANKIANEVRYAFQKIPSFNLFDPVEVS